MNKAVKALLKDLEDDGFEVTMTRSNHFKAKKQGKPAVFIPGTPSDYRSLNNVYSKLKRVGYERKKK